MGGHNTPAVGRGYVEPPRWGGETKTEAREMFAALHKIRDAPRRLRCGDSPFWTFNPLLLPGPLNRESTRMDTNVGKGIRALHVLHGGPPPFAACREQARESGRVERLRCSNAAQFHGRAEVSPTDPRRVQSPRRPGEPSHDASAQDRPDSGRAEVSRTAPCGTPSSCLPNYPENDFANSTDHPCSVNFAVNYTDPGIALGRG